MRIRRAALGLLAATGAAFGAFILWKSWRVARELTDPPFYHPQPLARVDATFQDLARGGQGDPGGTWEARPLGNLEVWRLRRAASSRGVVVLLHGFGDDRWGTSPALRWFPDLDAVIFTYLGRDAALRRGESRPVTFGARESLDVVAVVRDLEASGVPRRRILLLGRSLGASVGLLALARLEADGGGPLGGILWEGAPASSRSFAERLVRGPEDRPWHPFVAPLVGALGSRWAAHLGGYDRHDTDLARAYATFRPRTPGLCFLATQDRLADPQVQARVAARFQDGRVVSVPTWHLNCAPVLGRAYDDALHAAVRDWLP